MIMRIFRVTVYPDRRDEFRDFFVNQAPALMAGQDGLARIHFGLPRPEAPDTFAIVMLWRDIDAIRAFVGDDWRTPHVDPAEEGLVRERVLEHYDLAA